MDTESRISGRSGSFCLEAIKSAKSVIDIVPVDSIYSLNNYHKSLVGQDRGSSI